MTDTGSNRSVSINPGFFVDSSILDLTMEQAISRMFSPPKDPPTSNRISFRRVLPSLMETIGSYAARKHLTRARITFNLSDYGIAWVESIVGCQDLSFGELSGDCANAGRLDLLELMNKSGFLKFGWPEYSNNGTTIVVPNSVKGRASVVADTIGVDAGAIMQVGLAWAWTRSEMRDSCGTVEKVFVPVVNRFRELADYNRDQMLIIRKLLNRYLAGGTLCR